MTLKWLPGLPLIGLVFLTAFMMRDAKPDPSPTPEAEQRLALLDSASFD